MKRLPPLFLLALLAFSCSRPSLSEWVNPLIGTARHNDGAVCPFVGRPYAMTKFTPQTSPDAVCTKPYFYEDQTLFGFLASHKPQVGCMGDYGYVSVMPQWGAAVRTTWEDRALPMDKASEQSAPHLYCVRLKDEGGTIGVRMSAASRAGVLEFTFSDASEAAPAPRVIVQGIELDPRMENWMNDVSDRIAADMKGWIKADPERREVVGYNPDRMSHTWGPELQHFKGWFVIRFDQPFTTGGFFDKETQTPLQEEGTGTRCGVWVDFPAGTRQVRVQVGSSFISLDQARKNIRSEAKGFSVDRIASATRKAWDDKLARLTVENVSDGQKRVFYTAVYHIYQLPREMSEDGRYYSPFDEQIHKGVSFNDFATWDTFRSLHPLMTLLEPRQTGKWIQSLAQTYREGGWLPKWPNPTYTNIMIGTHADAIIADAWTKGIRGFDRALAYEAMMKDATVPPDEDTLRRYSDREKTRTYEARAGLTWYRTIGYVPADKTAESVSRTVEFGVDDWAIAQVARMLGKEDDYRMLMEQSQHYRNLYNQETGFLAPRHSDGSWMPFDLEQTFHAPWYSADGAFCEANPWNYLFGAMHDVEGMVAMMGPERFQERLDQVYDLGKYNHGNEPAHHYDYLYNFIGDPRKTQEKVREDVRGAYWDAPEGMVGNDDCGQMSAWYLFSCMGIYQMAPGSARYEFGAPQLPLIRMRLGNHTLTFIADGLDEAHYHVREIRVDGKKWDRLYITHEELCAAREIRYIME